MVDALKTKNMAETLSLGSTLSTAITVEQNLFVWGNGEKGYVDVVFLK
jgi:hypothetical protein